MIHKIPARLTILILLLSTTFIFARDIYIGADWGFSSSKEKREKKHPIYDDDKYSNYLSGADKTDITLRIGQYISKRNKIGIQYMQINGDGVDDYKTDTAVSESGYQKYDYKHNYGGVSAVFGQEIWRYFIAEARLGWGWYSFEVEDHNDDIENMLVRDDSSTSPLLGFGLGWNQPLKYKLSLSATMNWNYMYYVDSNIANSSLFSVNLGINWGLKDHRTVAGKN